MAENELYKTALSNSMALCSQREYCRSDIEEKLQKWGVNNADCQKIINTLTNENFINEERYARAFVNDKFRHNKWGKIKISYHLRARKISPQAINDALESIDNEQYISTIKMLIEGHKKSVRAKNDYDLRARLLRFGQSRGFESSLLYDILNDTD